MSEFQDWPADDQDAALAWMLEDRQRHSCGHPLHESTDPEVDWVGETVVCRACQAIAQAERPHRDAGTVGVVSYAVRD